MKKFLWNYIRQYKRPSQIPTLCFPAYISSSHRGNLGIFCGSVKGSSVCLGNWKRNLVAGTPSEAFWLRSSCAKHLGGREWFRCHKVPRPPSLPTQLCSIHLVASVHHHPGEKSSLKTRKESARGGEEGTDCESLVGLGCQHHLRGNTTKKATPVMLNCTFSDGWSATSQWKNKNNKGVFQTKWKEKIKGKLLCSHCNSDCCVIEIIVLWSCKFKKEPI